MFRWFHLYRGIVLQPTGLEVSAKAFANVSRGASWQGHLWLECQSPHACSCGHCRQVHAMFDNELPVLVTCQYELYAIFWSFWISSTCHSVHSVDHTNKILESGQRRLGGWCLEKSNSMFWDSHAGPRELLLPVLNHGLQNPIRTLLVICGLKYGVLISERCYMMNDFWCMIDEMWFVMDEIWFMMCWI